jgi:hypothetical protein
MGVMESSRTARPVWSVTTAPGGSRTSRPGIRGVVTTTSSTVGDGIGTAWAVSIAGIQMVYPSAMVSPATRSTPTSKTP